MMPGDVVAALDAGVHPISADSDARPVPQVGGELPDFGREEINQTRVPLAKCTFRNCFCTVMLRRMQLREMQWAP